MREGLGLCCAKARATVRIHRLGALYEDGRLRLLLLGEDLRSRERTGSSRQSTRESSRGSAWLLLLGKHLCLGGSCRGKRCLHPRLGVRHLSGREALLGVQPHLEVSLRRIEVVLRREHAALRLARNLHASRSNQKPY